MTLTVEMAADPVLDSGWATQLIQLTQDANIIVVDSFNNQQSNISSGWESGIPIGMKSGDNYTKGVRLFAKVNSEGVTAYILAEGDGAVIFPQSSSSLFAKLTQVTSITFGNIDTSNVTTMVV